MIKQVSTGVKQEKKEENQLWAPSTERELICSLGLARTSLKRFFQSLTSWSSMGPPLAGCWLAIVR